MSRKVTKPWGWEIIWAETDYFVGKMLFIQAGQRLSRQYHEKKDETIYVVQGALTLEIGEGEEMEVKTLIPGSSYHITPGTVHRFCATRVRVILMEVSTPELDDVIRIEDDYERD